MTDAAAPALAGPEIGVASTKTFTCQLAAMACLAITLGRARGAIDEAWEAEFLAELVLTPGLIAETLKLEHAVEILAHAIARARDVPGPIALTDKSMPVIAIAPRDAVFEKTVSNMQEVAARGGRLILIGEKLMAQEASVEIEHLFGDARHRPQFCADRLCRPIQMLAYHTAVIMVKDATSRAI